jgi:hypothetical protein
MKTFAFIALAALAACRSKTETAQTPSAVPLPAAAVRGQGAETASAAPVTNAMTEYAAGLKYDVDKAKQTADKANAAIQTREAQAAAAAEAASQ